MLVRGALPRLGAVQLCCVMGLHADTEDAASTYRLPNLSCSA